MRELRWKSKEMSKTEINECAYCGVSGITSQEHVIPECLFEQPLPNNMITVRACADCNTLKSKDDDYLRDYLVTNLSIYKQKIPQRLFAGKMARSMQRNSSSFAKEVNISKIVDTPFFSNGERLSAVYFDLRRLQDILEKIVKGLFYYAKAKRIADETKIKVSNFNYNQEEIEKIELMVKQETHILHRVGDGTTFYFLTAFFESEGELASYWMLVFYEKFCIEAKTSLLAENSKDKSYQ